MNLRKNNNLRVDHWKLNITNIKHSRHQIEITGESKFQRYYKNDLVAYLSCFGRTRLVLIRRWRIRTGVPHRRVQQVHGSSAQAQSVHPVRGLFEIRHHARGAEGRPESGRTERCRSPGVQVLRSPVLRSAPAGERSGECGQKRCRTGLKTHRLNTWVFMLYNTEYKCILIHFICPNTHKHQI